MRKFKEEIKWKLRDQNVRKRFSVEYYYIKLNLKNERNK